MAKGNREDLLVDYFDIASQRLLTQLGNLHDALAINNTTKTGKSFPCIIYQDVAVLLVVFLSLVLALIFHPSIPVLVRCSHSASFHPPQTPWVITCHVVRSTCFRIPLFSNLFLLLTSSERFIQDSQDYQGYRKGEASANGGWCPRYSALDSIFDL